MIRLRNVIYEIEQSFSSPGTSRYWMDPKGKLYDCSKIGHREWAKAYIKKVSKNKRIFDDEDYDGPYNFLFNLKWVRIVYSSGWNGRIFFSSNIPISISTLKLLKQKVKELNATSLVDDDTRKEIPL